MKCYRCGGELILYDSRQVKGGTEQRRKRKCRMCGQRIATRERYVPDFEDEKRKLAAKKRQERAAAHEESVRVTQELRKYCNGDNCLTCKFTRCKHDVADGTGAEKKRAV